MKRTVVIACSALALALLASPAAAQQAPDAATLYSRNCASCHGAAGVPNPAMARTLANIPDFTNAQTMNALADSTLVNAVTNGKGRTMPAYKTRLTADQIRAVVAHLRTFSRHSGS